jgi:APA family basic amino acid/polyamine antiporter
MPPAPTPQLARDLGVGAATAIVVGTIIGSGIFLVPAEMTQAVGSAKLVYLAWIVGGLLSFAGALTYAELGAMKPQSGGEYVYVRDAYGPLWGFLYGWTWFLIAKPASIATITTGIVRILGTFPAFSFFSTEFLHAPIALNYGQLAAILAAILISVLNYLGVKKAGEFQLIFTILKVAIILGIIAICFSASQGTWHNFAGDFVGAKGGIAGFFAALVAALWAYDGWNDLNMVAEEVRQPERNIPIALIAGVAIVGALYILVNAAVQYVLPVDAIAISQRPASDAIAVVLGPLGRQHRFGWYGSLHVRHFERNHHEWRACSVRGRAGRLFFSRARRCPSPLPHAIGGHRRAVRARDPAAAWRRKLSPIFFARYLRRVAVLHDFQQHRVRLP